eukprot:365595-Chlamydomonas_euryale.AAC.15
MSCSCKTGWMDEWMDEWMCMCGIVGVKLTDRHRLETMREQCGTPSLELMVRRRTLQWMGHVLRINKDRLPRQVFDCSLASSAIRGCPEEGSGSGTTFRDFLKLPGHTKLIPWLEIRAAAAERALDRQAWQDAIKNLAPWREWQMLCNPA